MDWILKDFDKRKMGWVCLLGPIIDTVVRAIQAQRSVVVAEIKS